MSYPSAPPGTTKKDPVDPATIAECWIQPTMFPNLARYNSDPTKQPYLNDMIIAACAYINLRCNRKFNKQQYDYIVANETLNLRDYKTYVLPNRPLITVDNVWLQVVDTFAVVTDSYFQVMTYESVLKILPTFSVYVQTTLPMYALNSASDLWIRFTSGYAVDYSDSNVTNEVPTPVRVATSMYVDYLFSTGSLTGGVSEFRTQTYSQKSSVGDNDPILSAIDSLLKPYVINNVR